MATTDAGLPYPLPSEPVSQGAAAIQDLAEAVGDRFLRLNTAGENHDFFTSRLENGGGITAKAVGDTAQGVLNWKHDSDFGFLLHMTTGPNASGLYGPIGVGVDNGGVGILVNNKATGRGIYLEQRASVSNVNGFGFHGQQLNTATPLMFLQQTVASAAPALRLSATAAAAGQKLMDVSTTALGTVGQIDVTSGALQWLRTIEAFPTDPATVPIIAKGAASQTAALQEWRSSTGLLVSVAASGSVVLNGTGGRLLVGDDTSGRVNIRSGATTQVALSIRGVASQTGDLTRWLDDAGNAGTGMAIDKDRRLKFFAGAESSTASAGAATLPAAPVGFFAVTDSAGVVRKVPYYA